MNTVIRDDRYLVDERASRNDGYERAQMEALARLREMDAYGIRSNLSAVDVDGVAKAYASFRATRRDARTTSAPVRKSDRIAPDSLFSARRFDAFGDDQRVGPDEEQEPTDDPAAALLEKMRNAWKTSPRNGRKGDDSMPQNHTRGGDPTASVTKSPANDPRGVPATPRSAVEHGVSAFGGQGNEGDNSGSFGTPPFDFDDGGAMKAASDSMIQRQKDAWRQPRRAR
jgi:hypothetical protein